MDYSDRNIGNQQTFQIDGTFTYAENIKTLELGDLIILKIQKKESVGAFIQKNGKKIGYVPYKPSQLNMNAKYKVVKLLLNKNVQVLIAIDYEPINNIIIEPKIIQEYKDFAPKILSVPEYENDLKSWAKKLEIQGHKIDNIGITWYNQDWINLLIQYDNITTIFHCVSRNYYEKNIFLYDEFYYRKLSPTAIYQPWMVHRLEEYIFTNYKSNEKLTKQKNVLFIEKEEKTKPIDIEEPFDWFKLNLLYHQSKNPLYYHPKLRQLNINIDIDWMNDYKLGSLAFNHELRAYCFIDLMNESSIIEILPEKIKWQQIEPFLYNKLKIVNKEKVIVYYPESSLKITLSINNNVQS